MPSGFSIHWFEKPSKDDRRHPKSLYIEARFDEVLIKRVLIDNGASINILPLATFKKLERDANELVNTDVVVSGFNGRVSACLGVITISLRVGRREKETIFFVINVAPIFNASLGRDWLHKARDIPATLHQELDFWYNDKMKVVGGTLCTN